MVHHRYDLRRSPIYCSYFSLNGDGRVAPHGYSPLYWWLSRNEIRGVVHMIKVTVSEFEAMLARPDWQHTQRWLTTSSNIYTGEEAVVWDGRLDDAVRRGAKAHIFHAKIMSTIDMLTITYTTEFEYTHLGRSDYFKTLKSLSGVIFDGFMVVNDAGIEIPANFLVSRLGDGFVCVDIDGFLDRITPPYKCFERRGWYYHYSLRVDGAPDLAFVGKLLAECDDVDLDEGFELPWQEIKLYQTKMSGRYVCCQNIYYEEEQDRYSAVVCDSMDEVIAFFGYSRLAKELYEIIEVDTVHSIE